MEKIIIDKLKRYFGGRPEVLFAYLFGSCAAGLEREESDIDIAVYFNPLNKRAEYEKRQEYPQESEIRFDLVRMLETDNLDLVVLNQAYPVLASSIIEYGIPIVIKDENLLLEFLSTVQTETEDFYGFVEDYWRIYQEAHSLSPQQRVRLLERIQYLDIEIKEASLFKGMTFDIYRENKVQRRNLERWVENIANVTIDIAKIILASEKKQMPKSYKDALFDFGFFFGLKEEEAKRFSEIADLRNLLAHEYLDILYEKIRNFLISISPFYEKLVSFLKNYTKEAAR